MATEQGIGLSFSRRTALKNVVRLIPAVMIIAVTLNALSCGGSGLLSSAGSGSGSPTATPTTGTGTFAFVTNFGVGEVSAFTRDTTTGVLTSNGKPVSAGAPRGPRGVVASPDGSYLYVANINDDNIYKYSINSDGTLTKLASGSNGTGTQPDELAINSDGSLLWVTGKAGTIKSYQVNTSGDLSGQIIFPATSTTSGGGLQTPFGIAVHPTLNVLYVSDSATGNVYAFNYDTTTTPPTGVLSQNSAPQHSLDTTANAAFGIAIDSGGDALFIADQGNGDVSSFSIAPTGAAVPGALTPYAYFPNSSATDGPVGIGIGGGYLFTANSSGDSISSFIVTDLTLTTPPALVTGYSGATGLVVDPLNMFVYTTNFSNNTVGQAIIEGSTCTIQLCAGKSISTASGPFGITLAQ